MSVAVAIPVAQRATMSARHDTVIDRMPALGGFRVSLPIAHCQARRRVDNIGGSTGYDDRRSADGPPPCAGVVKLADARDSKSRGVYAPCRFDSDLRHQIIRRLQRFRPRRMGVIVAAVGFVPAFVPCDGLSGARR